MVTHNGDIAHFQTQSLVEDELSNWSRKNQPFPAVLSHQQPESKNLNKNFRTENGLQICKSEREMLSMV